MILRLIFLFIFLQIAFANVLITEDNFEIRYPLKFEKSCYIHSDRFNYILGISMSKCVKECSAREHCQTLCYRRKLNVCELFSSWNERNLRPGNCIFIAKQNINTVQSPCENGCNYGEVCEVNKSDAGVCVIKECINVAVPKHGGILGNQRAVGNRIRYECNSGFTASNSSIAECMDTGVWNVYSTCVTAPTIGSSCLSNADCLETEGKCIDGICFCHPLYHYSVSQKDCTRVCNAMSNTFGKLNNALIVDFDDLAPGTVHASLDVCQTACVEDPNCSSFEAWLDKNFQFCSRSSVSLQMARDAVPGALQFQPNVQLFTRNCV